MVTDLLEQCRALGVTLAPGDNGALRISPPGVLPDDLKAELKAHKAALLQLLAAPSPTPEVIDATYQRIWVDYDVRDGTYTPEQLRQARKVVKPGGPVRTYRLVAVKQYSETLGRWLLVITEASGDVPRDARFLTPVAGGRALAWLTAEQLQHAACLPPAAEATAETEQAREEAIDG